LFAAAPPRRAEEHENLLAVRVAGELYALRVRDVSGVERCPRIVPLPSRVPELLGLVGIRGGLVPVYGLAALVSQAGVREAVRWLILCGGVDPVGLGLGQIEGWLRLPRSELCAPAGKEASGTQPREIVRAGGVLRAVIDIPSVLETLKTRITSSGPFKET
jgi:chemotaxis signal transduction protein